MSLKILMCCHLPLDPKLGGAKVYIDNARSYKEQGCEVVLLGLDDLGEVFTGKTLNYRLRHYSKRLRRFLIKNAKDFDVVEFEYFYHPFRKPIAAKNTLFVARSVLLEHHLLDFSLPGPSGRPFSNFLKSLKQNILLRYRLWIANKTLRNADLVSVPNKRDKDRICSQIIPNEKVIVAPYGYFEEINDFETDWDAKNIVYIASFDPRKGCFDLPALLKTIANRGFKLRLLGVKGRYQDEDSIRKEFPSQYQDCLDIVMTFNEHQLNELLKDCSLGIFPSYLESFGFGLLEMIQRGIPVLAYDVPGPSDLLPAELLVRRGDLNEFTRRLETLMDDNKKVREFSNLCKDKTLNFRWSDSTKKTLDFYNRALNGLRLG